ITIEKRYVCADDRTIWANVNVALVRDRSGEPLYFASVINDITESHRLSEKLSHQATHDALTGLINRYEFERRMKQAVERARVEHVDNALCFLDLDQFKIVNDTCGHGAGDAMLEQLSGLLRGCIRSNDTLARLGGDEFALLLEACPPESALAVAEKIRRTVHDYEFHWEEQKFNLGASIGVVPFGAGDIDIDKLLSAADTACYAAKEAGRNRVHLVGEGDDEIHRHQEAMRWQQELREAMTMDRFFLVWQPIHAVGGDRDRPEHFEVLLRLRDSKGHVVPPGEFMPSAERYGMIRRMDRWVLEESLRWLAENPVARKRIASLSINLSGLTFSERGFADEVLTLLKQYNLGGDQICFEITETATITNMAAARELIGTLQAMGCRFALDDFGMGFASFAYLNSFPVDCVKIDGTFVRDMDTNHVHRAMVRSINDIAHAMGKETVAEFVENEKVWQMLSELGVDYGQGFGVGRPQALGEMTPKIDE
ncbi:MAG: EAL domain-containing protein, partial [Gammaproteobacteria bacterium]|nr:EAL domain-containing protein [Gammaproteobacteria bacterium]